jgi:RNA polymerase sigma factor for flagellar operon FliA
VTGTASDLIEAHLGLVRIVVCQVAPGFPPHVDRDELAAAGNLGLVEAAARFDPARGVPFGRFASVRIRGAILDAVRATDWAPRSVRLADRRVVDVERRFIADRGRRPSPAELAEALQVTVTALARIRERSDRAVVLHLEVPAGEDGPATVGDLVADAGPGPGSVLEDAELAVYLADAVRLLPVLQRTVAVGYFVQGRSSRSLADQLGVTISRVSQLRSEACRMLRDGITAQYRDRPTTPPSGRAARRRDDYATAIGRARPWPDRLTV